jgi:hypothetical protein
MRAKKLSVATENQEQRALVRWLLLHPTLKDFFCKLNNEGLRTAAQGRNLQLMGLRPGAVDLFIYHPNTSHTLSGLWIEVKKNMHYPPSARRSDTWIAQQKFIDTVRTVGFAGEFCYGWIDGKEIIELYISS